MNPVLNAALGRAFMISVLVGGLTLLTTRQLTVDANGVSVNPSWEKCLIAGGVAFISAFLARGFGEGGYDTKRAADGNINAGDVPVASDKVTVTTP